MRIRLIGAAAVCLAAAPAWAQSPEVSGPRTLTTPMVMCTDLPAATKPTPKLFVKGPHLIDGGRGAVTSGTLVVGRAPEDGLAVGQRYFTFRIVGDLKKFPRPGEGYGDLRVTGWMTVTAMDEVNALAEINFACDSIETGDFLEPFAEIELPKEASAMIPPDFSDRANVLFGVNNRVLFGDGDVMSIDRGTLHGVVPGARYALYRDLRNGMPLVHLGEAVVLVVSETTSKVVVISTADGVEPGDIVVPRRVP
jgi:hypothetical protein